MSFTLPPLPYAANALEPHIDARTMEIHHTKHHQAYTDNLNAALEKHPELQGRSDEGHTLLSSVYGRFSEGFDTADLITARQMVEAAA